ncbi:MAG: LIC_10190 family membrane protein [Bacteroidia bacterium]
MFILIPYYLILSLIAIIWAQLPFWLLKLKKPENVFLDILFGILLLSILSLLFVVGGPINLLTQAIFVFSTLAIAYLQREEMSIRLKLLLSALKQFSKTDILILTGILIPILYQAAQATKINDNGGYYQPTIAWMEQVGLVKGLANIYPALGLYSSWHSLTALFDLNQLGLGSYHQINGFLFCAILFWLFRELKLNIIMKYKILLLGILGYIVLFGFFFLSAPNADLPMICFSGLLIYLFLYPKENFHPLIWWLLGFALFAIKPPASTALIISLLVIIQKQFSFKSKLNSLILILPLIFLLIYKNVILSGYAIYPLNKPDIFKVEWKVPPNWNELYRVGIVSWGIQDKYEIKDWNQAEKEKPGRLSKWLFRSGYKGLMNKLIFTNFCLLVILSIFSLAIRRNLSRQLLLLIFLLLLFQGIEWLYLSQYRLMLATGLSILLINIYLVFHTNQNWPNKISKPQFIINGTSIMLILFLWMIAFVPFSMFASSSRNKSITKSEGFNTRYLVEPWHQFDNGPINTNRFNNMVFYYYPERVYCWDCPLPCVSKSHHDFLLKNLGLEITPLGNSIRDGFKLSKK